MMIMMMMMMMIGRIAGPWDIALLRLRETVIFLPRLISPVSLDDAQTSIKQTF